MRRYALLRDKPTFHLPHVEGNVAIKPSSDLRHLFPPVINQGDLGDCTAASGVALRYAMAVKSGQKPPEFDPISLYVWERQQDGTYPTDAGSRLSTTAIVTEQRGQAPENAPYSTDNFNLIPPESVVTSAAPWKIKSAKRVVSLQGILETLSEGIPVHLGIIVYPSMEYDTTVRDGIVPMPQPGEQPLGGHAIVGVGYENSKQMVLCRNSWGTEYGNGGYFYLPYDYFRSSTTWMSAWRWEV